ncbi:hypothetical protein EON63_12545 [archaeon]|nr:MAG: hypothetical protein EON63_12545 [archaeon]
MYSIFTYRTPYTIHCTPYTRVRRACAESLSEISKHVSDDIRLGVLVEIFLRLAHDPSKLVKQSILQQSGRCMGIV